MEEEEEEEETEEDFDCPLLSVVLSACRSSNRLSILKDESAMRKRQGQPKDRDRDRKEEMDYECEYSTGYSSSIPPTLLPLGSIPFY
jgi:hypothetical protein